MSWIAAIPEFLKSLPVILSALLQLKKLWDQSIEVTERRQKMGELKNALKGAVASKDTTGVESFFKSLNK